MHTCTAPPYFRKFHISKTDGAETGVLSFLCSCLLDRRANNSLKKTDTHREAAARAPFRWPVKGKSPSCRALRITLKHNPNELGRIPIFLARVCKQKVRSGGCGRFAWRSMAN